TEGRLELGELVCLNGTQPDELLAVAASAEQKSEHPIARLILHEATERKLNIAPVEDFQAQPGAGVTARAGGNVLVIGTRRLLQQQGIELTPEALERLEQLDAAGQTSLLVARDGVILGILGARDRVRPEAVVVLKE